VLGSITSQSSISPTKLKGISPVPPKAKDDSISRGSSLIQETSYAVISRSSEVSTMENLKDQGKSGSNIQIHPSFTYQIGHGEEGIEHLRKAKPKRKAR
jgi:hypothetical protein